MLKNCVTTTRSALAQAGLMSTVPGFATVAIAKLPNSSWVQLGVTDSRGIVESDRQLQPAQVGRRVDQARVETGKGSPEGRHATAATAGVLDGARIAQAVAVSDVRIDQDPTAAEERQIAAE